MEYASSQRSGSVLSEAPSYESLKCRQQAPRYSHPLYSATSKSKDNVVVYAYELEESKFSSTSSSPNSSCISLVTSAAKQSQSTRASAAPSALSAALSSNSSIRTARSASCFTSRFADDHYPLISSISQYTAHVAAPLLDMAHAYNTYIRAINSCFNHAMFVDASEISDFLFFNQTLFNVLSQHLQTEQQYLQPLLHRPASDRQPLFRRSLSIHEDNLFVASFQAWGNFIHDQSTQMVYSGDELQAHINSFAPRLVQHLHDGVAQLNELVFDGILMSEHLAKIWSKFEETLANGLDRYTDAALLVGCHDRNFTINGRRSEQHFPKLPTGATTMIKKWHSRRHDSAWRYCSSDFSGRRRFLSL